MRSPAKSWSQAGLISALPLRLVAPMVLAWGLSGVLGAAVPGVMAAAEPGLGEVGREIETTATRRAFFAEASASVHISVSGGTEESPCYPRIHLYAPDGRLLARMDGGLNLPLPYTGHYKVRIDGCIDNLRIRIMPPPLPDQYELDDSALAARLLPTDGTPQLHSLHAPLDQDWVTFYVPEEQVLTVETYCLRGFCDTVLTLCDVELNQLAFSDNYAGEERSFIQLLIPQAGQYFARVHHRAGRGEEGKTYLLRARLATPVYGGSLRSPRQVTFPVARVGAVGERTVQLTNLHRTELLRLFIQQLDGPFTTEFPAGETILLPRRSIRFKVRFAPTTKGSAAGRLVFNTSDPTQPTITIPLSGRGL